MGWLLFCNTGHGAAAASGRRRCVDVGFDGEQQRQFDRHRPAPAAAAADDDDDGDDDDVRGAGAVERNAGHRFRRWPRPVGLFRQVSGEFQNLGRLTTKPLCTVLTPFCHRFEFIRVQEVLGCHVFPHCTRVGRCKFPFFILWPPSGTQSSRFEETWKRGRNQWGHGALTNGSALSRVQVAEEDGNKSRRRTTTTVRPNLPLSAEETISTEMPRLTTATRSTWSKEKKSIEKKRSTAT